MASAKKTVPPSLQLRKIIEISLLSTNVLSRWTAVISFFDVEINSAKSQDAIRDELVRTNGDVTSAQTLKVSCLKTDCLFVSFTHFLQCHHRVPGHHGHCEIGHSRGKRGWGTWCNRWSWWVWGIRSWGIGWTVSWRNDSKWRTSTWHRWALPMNVQTYSCLNNFTHVWKTGFIFNMVVMGATCVQVRF